MVLPSQPARHFTSYQGDGTGRAAPPALLPDCAGQHLLISVDMLNADVHFSSDDAPFNIGHKALAVNLSDLAAMGARARWVSVALRLPDKLSDQWFADFCAGFDALAAEHSVTLRALDVAQGALSVTVEALGTAPPGTALRRSGAQPGDRILVSGSLGEAACALRQRLAGVPLETDAQRALAQRLERPQPRLALGLRLRRLASSAIDVSDGLCADLGHILRASKVGATLNADRLPLSEALRASTTPQEARLFALAGGDDYELCFTIRPERCEAAFAAAHQLGVAVTDIGAVESRTGLQVLDERGCIVDIGKTGFDHFEP